MINKTLALTLFGLVAFSGVTASAEPASDLTAVRINYKGIDIQSEKGAKIVLHKIETAAAEICRDQASTRLEEVKLFRPCTREIVSRTVAQVNSPALKALYSGKTQVTMAQQASTR